MRRAIIAAIGLLASAGTSSFASDLPQRVSPSTALVFGPAYSWTGFYAGINVGYGWGHSAWSTFGGNADPASWVLGLTVGYNWQGPGSPYVFGLEGDFNWTRMRDGFTSAACPTGCETKNNWLATVRGRLGYAMDRLMPYITGGFAFGDIDATRTGVGGVSSTQAGWTIGVGIEGAIAPNWTAKLEYLYVDLGNIGCGPPTCIGGSNINYSSNIVRTGVNVRF